MQIVIFGFNFKQTLLLQVLPKGNTSVNFWENSQSCITEFPVKFTQSMDELYTLRTLPMMVKGLVSGFPLPSNKTNMSRNFQTGTFSHLFPVIYLRKKNKELIKGNLNTLELRSDLFV